MCQSLGPKISDQELRNCSTSPPQAVVVAADVYGNANKAKMLYLSRQIVDISWIMKIPFNSLLDRSKKRNLLIVHHVPSSLSNVGALRSQMALVSVLFMYTGTQG